ncbi:MAG: site-specific DNA-methyltransferase [Bacteroidales bacterium]|nr:site-specific DNA-methyltransferase [Bacteroidales bacterium]
MSNKKQLQKLELTWIGKGEEPKLEPRILIENPEYSYGDPNSPNMLIHGDNLLALKALEQDYAGKVKCIYIDPPFNTGAAFEHYDDGVEHSIWLDLMYKRLKILKNLLSKDGVIIVHLDDNEFHYLKVVMDEIFGRENFVSTIAIKSSTPSGLKTTHKDKTIIKTKDLILVYKNYGQISINPLYTKRDEWDTHYSKFLDKETDTIHSLIDVLIKENIVPEGTKLKDVKLTDKFYKFYSKYKNNIFQTQPVMPAEHKQNSLDQRDILYKYESEGGTNYAMNGRRFAFLSNSLNIIEDDTEDLGILLCDFWNDIDFQNTQNEGGNSFPASKKPEKLIFRFLKMFTKEGDLVMDSFLGSGTTAAVAHKMGRNYIGVELGNHAYSHCYTRLKAVVDGEKSGISDTLKWQGGGGFKFYTLAPSLLKQDKFGNWVISQEYNADMLAAAMAKQEGFKYQPHESTYWKQGQSAEQDFIFTTTQFLTVEALDSIKDEMQPGETLLICCKSFQKECKGKFSNITIKKIPLMLLGRCEYGKEDYSLNIINMPVSEQDSEDFQDGQDLEDVSVQELADKNVKSKKTNNPSLFD